MGEQLKDQRKIMEQMERAYRQFQAQQDERDAENQRQETERREQKLRADAEKKRQARQALLYQAQQSAELEQIRAYRQRMAELSSRMERRRPPSPPLCSLQ